MWSKGFIRVESLFFLSVWQFTFTSPDDYCVTLKQKTHKSETDEYLKKWCFSMDAVCGWILPQCPFPIVLPAMYLQIMSQNMKPECILMILLTVRWWHFTMDVVFHARFTHSTSTQFTVVCRIITIFTGILTTFTDLHHFNITCKRQHTTRILNF